MTKSSTPSRQATDKTVFLFGPTAVGKTELLASVFADRFEVVNADSVQVYRGLDIGSAKADSQIRSIIPHHLIDIRDPWQQFTVGDFVAEAENACSLIRSRGRIPVLSGGTAYYFKHFLYGLPCTPKADESTRASVKEKMEALGLEKSYELLRVLDPQSAQRIHPNDAYRISRALEVYASSGKRLSECTMPSKPREDMETLVIGLMRDKDELARRMELRVEQMFSSGLVEEIRGLVAGNAQPWWPGLQGIGYKEFFDAMSTGELSLSMIKSRILSDSKKYAKRQMTFFKSFGSVHWVDAQDKDQVRALLDDFLL